MDRYIKKQARFFDEKLKEYLPVKENPQKLIYEAMAYSLNAGGKRLRPFLLTETAKMCGLEPEKTVPFAVAIEMIHTYSLIHDDLPAMDNDDLRRGIPTNHIKFGEANAILAGDALLNKAFEIMLSVKNISADNVLAAAKAVADASGTEGMIGGQIVDIQSENKKISLDELKYIHSLKTGALIKAACVCGAELAGASEEEKNCISDYAVNLGIAFQIQDDILDVLGNEEELGKPIGSDAENGKNTYVALCGIERASELMTYHGELAKSALGRFGEKADILVGLIDYLSVRRS